MKTATIVLAAVLVVAFVGGGYFFATQHQPLKDRYKQIATKKSDLERTVADLNQELNLKVAEISKARKEKARYYSSML